MGARSNVVVIIYPLVEIGLTDLPKSREAHAPLAPPLATGLAVTFDFGFVYSSPHN